MKSRLRALHIDLNTTLAAVQVIKSTQVDGTMTVVKVGKRQTCSHDYQCDLKREKPSRIPLDCSTLQYYTVGTSIHLKNNYMKKNYPEEYKTRFL